MEELIQLKKFPVKDVLAKLLQDKSTGKNIIFATDTYRFYGQGYSDTDEITTEALFGFGASEIQPRVMKTSQQQSERTRKKAEVFSPTWIVRKMNDHCDSVWQEENNSDEWQKYVQLRVLEITCGEAPFLATRYDMTTGELLPTAQRTGMLDRKLQTINAHAADEKEWLKWTYKAYQSTYGYEYQGDSLLIARVNLLVTFCEYYEEKFQKQPEKSELSKITNIIAWNVWQMDGLKDTVPLGMPGEKFPQLSLFDDEPEKPQEDDCKIYDWRSKKTLLFRDVKEVDTKMKFDFVIGNPPYQDNTLGENDTYAPPVYHLFMDAAYSVADKVELITPARFLFNAGSTPKTWNNKMLNDTHLKVLSYEEDSKKIFSNTEIKGGIAITYRDKLTTFGEISIFTPHEKLNSILKKLIHIGFDSLSSITITRTAYRLTDLLHKEHPEAINQLSKGHTFWLLNRVDSVKALAKKLSNHKIFKNYKIVIAAGNEKADEDVQRKKSFDQVRDAIDHNEKTITLSVGQLTTGVTIPEWTAVLMLSNIKSPALYMQAAFRAQNPFMFHYGSECHRKENAYVFDFDPARTLTIFEQFANDLSTGTSGSKGDSETRKNNVRELLNFFPVIGEDEHGEMIELDAEQVLVIPRKIYSQEVVRRGFIEDKVRDHLRGFSRTIPSFLMAYGKDDTTLANFDKIIPADVFLEVTGISIDEFLLMRDGADYTDDNGNVRHYQGNLFNSVVFDDSVREFMKKRRALANYFDESQEEDIFDYIPPQKTNQIFTPKNIVKKMVDMLEEENPGCFDDPNNTFADLYMKSGLYIAEIVKRLFNSYGMRMAFTNKTERLQHIFEKQVYGLAPTEIIYQIAVNFILGFAEDGRITKHNFRQVDALPYAKDGTLEQKLDEIFK